MAGSVTRNPALSAAYPVPSSTTTDTVARSGTERARRASTAPFAGKSIMEAVTSRPSTSQRRRVRASDNPWLRTTAVRPSSSRSSRPTDTLSGADGTVLNTTSRPAGSSGQASRSAPDSWPSVTTTSRAGRRCASVDGRAQGRRDVRGAGTGLEAAHLVENRVPVKRGRHHHRGSLVEGDERGWRAGWHRAHRLACQPLRLGFPRPTRHAEGPVDGQDLDDPARGAVGSGDEGPREGHGEHGQRGQAEEQEPRSCRRRRRVCSTGTRGTNRAVGSTVSGAFSRANRCSRRGPAAAASPSRNHGDRNDSPNMFGRLAYTSRLRADRYLSSAKSSGVDVSTRQ